MHPSRKSDRPVRIWPPLEVRTVCETYLDLVDEVDPGLVQGLYLHGSLGFGEWYANRSDVDFVAVTARRPDAAAVKTLREVHQRVGELFPRPSYDGFYLTWEDLARPPASCPDVPCILGGHWEDEGRMDVNPVTWHELARHGVTIRGADLADLDIWTDVQVLREFTHENLSTYWADEVAGLRQFPGEALRPEIPSWFVLGTPRLHHVLATGRLTSKDGAGRYAIEAFGERWRPLVNEALAYRARGSRDGIVPDERVADEVLEFADLVVTSGLAIRV